MWKSFCSIFFAARSLLNLARESKSLTTSGLKYAQTLFKGSFVLCNKWLVKLDPLVNFTNILQAAFLPISMHKKSTNVTCWYNLRTKKLLEDVSEINPWVYQTVNSKRVR